ncbi:MAG: hypothetical protein N2692_03070 [Patescibacteria group bacterium]|nr:hypothetical protein [Patescibacteria group bacterium]
MQIIEHIKAYATTKNYLPIIGTEYYQSLIGNKIIPSKNQIILLFDANVKIEVNRNKPQGYSYDVTFAVGRKFEDNTHANLIENFEEKYNNRLKDLTDILTSSIIEFACAYGYELSDLTVLLQLNRFSQNIDFVAAKATLTYT